jgi:hypothetical protein
VALTNKERKELKEQGYVYHRHFGKWMMPEEIERHEDNIKTAEQFEFWVGLIMVVGVFIWMFSLF